MEKHLGSATGYPPKENLDFMIGHVAFFLHLPNWTTISKWMVELLTSLDRTIETHGYNNRNPWI